MLPARGSPWQEEPLPLSRALPRSPAGDRLAQIHERGSQRFDRLVLSAGQRQVADHFPERAAHCPCQTGGASSTGRRRAASEGFEIVTDQAICKADRGYITHETVPCNFAD